MFNLSSSLLQSSFNRLVTLLSPSELHLSKVIDKNILQYLRSINLEHYHVHICRVVLAYSGGQAVDNTSSCSDRCHRDQTSCFICAITVANRNRSPLQEHNASRTGQERSGSLSRCRSIWSSPSTNWPPSGRHLLYQEDCKTTPVSLYQLCSNSLGRTSSTRLLSTWPQRQSSSMPA